MQRQRTGCLEWVTDKQPRIMVNTFILFFVCLFDVTDAVKTISVMEGDSVALNTEVQKCLLIQWRFGSTRIAEASRLTQSSLTYDGPDGRFRGRLKLDQTGSLTITNTRTTDSGLYTVTVISKDTSYMSFNLTVNESPPQSTSSPERSSSTNFVVQNNLTVDANITKLHQPCSDNIHCCGFNETVIRLALSALVGVATITFLVYEVRSTRSEPIRTEETRYLRQAHGVKPGRRYEMSRRASSRYVC